MKLDQLQYFVETARRQHIGQAARILNISPSAISHSIAALEEEFGKPLFAKHGRQIKLTTHGKLLLDRAEFLLAEAERIREELTSGQIFMRGHYRIAATQLLCSNFLAPVWMDVQKDHPGLTATMHSLRSGEVLSRVNAGELDLGICFCPQPDANHKQMLMHKGKLLFAFGKGHPFLKDKNLKDLESYPAIAAQASQGIDNCENHPSFQKIGLKPKITNLYDSYDVALGALKSNAAWTLIPDFLLNSYAGQIESYLPTGFSADYTVVAIWPKYHVPTEAIALVIEKMAQLIKVVAANV